MKYLWKKTLKTILRSHPETVKRSSKILKKIVKKFSNNVNFELNSDYEFKYSKWSSILITDNGDVLEYIIIQRNRYILTIQKIHNEYFDSFQRNF